MIDLFPSKLHSKTSVYHSHADIHSPYTSFFFFCWVALVKGPKQKVFQLSMYLLLVKYLIRLESVEDFFF